MLFLALCAVLPLTSLANVVVPVSNHWSGGFQAKACFTIDKELTSWHMHLIFDQPIQSLDVWTADVETSTADKTEWILDSKTWNAVEHVGQELCIDFMGHGSGDVVPVVTAYIDGLTGGGSHGGETSGPENTPAATTVRAAETTASPATTPTTPTTHTTHSTTHTPATTHTTHSTTHTPATTHTTHSTTHTPATTHGVSTHTTATHTTHTNSPHTTHAVTHGVTNTAPTFTVDDTHCGDMPNNANSKYNYDDVLYKSILFYEAQRSGKLPANNRIPWRGDSGLNDRGRGGEDLTGGWYDGGGFVKFTHPTAWSTAVLTWGLLEFKDAYEASGQLEWMYDSIKWPLDYLLKCHSADNVIYVQVGDGYIDERLWGRPEDMSMSRPSFKIDSTEGGADVAMEMVAAFASGYLAFQERDPTYAATLLQHAQTLYDFGIKHPGVYTNWIIESQGYYNSWDYNDDICWGSLWMYKATNKTKYITESTKYCHVAPYAWEFNWNHVFLGSQILLYQVTKQDTYKTIVEEFFQNWFPGGSFLISPKGLAYKELPGTLAYAADMAVAALMAAEAGIHPDEYRHWAMCQIHYSLGDAGHSFVVGFGENPPVSPHHRASSCPSPPAACTMSVLHQHTANPHVLCGALVGGPDGVDGYKDDREEYYYNDISIIYNAGFQTAVAGLRSLLLRNLHPEQKGSATCPYTSSAP